MTEGRHHRRRDDDHAEDGIYFPPPREVPRSRTAPQVRQVDPSPWAPTAPDRQAPEIPPAPPPGTPPPAREPPPRQQAGDSHPPEAPVYYARASNWTVRPSPWATTEDDELLDEDTYAPAEVQPPPPPVRPHRKHQEQEQRATKATTAPVPTQRPHDEQVPGSVTTQLSTQPLQQPLERPPAPRAVPAAPPPDRMSSTTAWWIAVGVVVVALAVAAGVLVGLNLARRGSPSGAAGATCGGPAALRLATGPEFAPAVERAATNIGGCEPVRVV
ncbi:hypothetical protein [Dactylosporangium sp. NPDC000521]|uniref:hypothetical protein n=1 Tax=Dactylosporangium sp. NPDC000521 TaxID=3363975 RepID=UPI003694867A